MGVFDGDPGMEREIGRQAKRQPIGTEEIRRAAETLSRYKSGKTNLEARIIANEQWWKLRHWDQMRKQHGGENDPKPSSGWMLNVLLAKHADAMDSYPEPNLLPREPGDKDEATRLSSIVPVVLEQCDYESVYSDAWWYKVKQGAACIGIFWDAKKLGGLGDIAIRRVDLLNLFWEPGISDIQQSRNLFCVELRDNEELEEQYPDLRGKLGGEGIAVAKYIYDDTVDTSSKSVVVDWYYHTQEQGRSVLQYCKFVGDTVLFSTENEAEFGAGGAGAGETKPGPDGRALPGYAGGIAPEGGNRMPDAGIGTQRTGDAGRETDGAAEMTEEPEAEAGLVPVRGTKGWYDHGLYPFVMDVLFPEEGTPAGYGYIDLCKDAQEQIDVLGNAILKNAIASATPRWFIRSDGTLNEEEYADLTKPFIHTNGNLGQDSVRNVEVPALPGNVLSVLQAKIDEMKEISGNRDVSNGGTTQGVTAASAIAAMQEQSGKLSRDQIQASYRAYRQEIYMVIELIRQFYSMPRQFRITGKRGEEQFVTYSNQGLQPQAQRVGGVDLGMRMPVFDIRVTAQKQNAYSKMSQNELALQLYGQGFFNPQMATQALACLDLMDFKDKEDCIHKVQENGDLAQRLAQTQLQLTQALQTLDKLQGSNFADRYVQEQSGQGGQSTAPAAAQTGGSAVQTDQTGSVRPQEHAYVRQAREQAQQATAPRQ